VEAQYACEALLHFFFGKKPKKNKKINIEQLRLKKSKKEQRFAGFLSAALQRKPFCILL